MSAYLPNHFYAMPQTASATMTTKQLREVLLNHEGRIIAKGVFWTIRSKHLGAGVHKVYLTSDTND